MTRRIYSPISPSSDGLLDNIIRFSNLLRAKKITVTFSSVLDVIHCVRFIDISDPKAFHALLRVNLVSRESDIAPFERLFQVFWLQDNFQNGRSNQAGSKKKEGKNKGGLEKKIRIRKKNKCKPDSNRQEQPASYSTYSIGSLKRLTSIDPFVQSPEFYEAVCQWLKPLRRILSRRRQHAFNGKKISLNRILRKNMQFGGELIYLDYLKKKIKKRRIIFLCDVSGSMDTHTMLILEFAHIFMKVDPHTEIFFFSTDLSWQTDHFRDIRLGDKIFRHKDTLSAFGGGTKIGHCLKEFTQIHGSQFMSNKSIIVIFSDGWDLGDIGILKKQMAYINHKFYKTIWLNPLIGTRGYQPICQGMEAALPYVDYFMPMGNLEDLGVLTKVLKKNIL